MDKMVIPNRVRVVALMLALALAGGLLTLALLAKPSQAQPPTDKENSGVSEQVEIGFGLDATDCAGEVVYVTGTMHIVNHFVGEVDPEGTPVPPYHNNYHINLMNVTAVGETSGAEYRVPAAYNSVAISIPASGQVNTGDVTIQRVIQQGSGSASGAEELFTAVVHYIVYDDGTVKAEVVQVQFECK
jgi:hypothetical protein